LSDGASLAISFAYVLGVVGLAEGLRRSGRVSFDLSRKIIHVGIGSWILPTVLLFHSRWMAAAPPAVFVLLNLLSLRGKWTRAMDAEAGENLGTVLFPLSFVILLLSLWDREAGKAAIAAGILVLAWGDAAAALVGLRWGKHRYRVGRGHRSLEGSAAMFVFSLLAILVAGVAVGARGPGAAVLPQTFAPWHILAAGLLATLLEAASRRGTDNLVVPVGTAFFLWGVAQLV
jgi:phytol kinase